MSRTAQEDAEVVSVTSTGQATIPKRFRDKLGIDTPGRVKFREDEDGDITLERVRSLSDFRGIASGETSLTDELRAEREREKDREDRRAAEFAGETPDEDADE